MTTSKLIFFGLLMAIAHGVQAQGITVEANTTANKTSFFQGEPVALDVIIKNNSDQQTTMCYCSRWKLYSKTYQKEGQDLKDIAPGPNPQRVVSSHPPVNTPASNTPAECTCDSPARGNVIIPMGSAVHHPILINTCDTFHGCYKGGVWTANLPLGDYEFTYYLFFSNAPSVEKKITFSIVEPTRLQRLYLEKLASIYDVNSIDNWLQLMETIHEPAIVDKILTRVVTNGYLGTHADFWAGQVARYSNDALLIHQLSIVTTMEDNDARRNRVDYYQRIIDNLKTKDDRVTDAFLKQIESTNLSKTGRTNYKTIPPDKIDKIKTDWKDRKRKKKGK
jgi:hypothetical protein